MIAQCFHLQESLKYLKISIMLLRSSIMYLFNEQK